MGYGKREEHSMSFDPYSDVEQAVGDGVRTAHIPEWRDPAKRAAGIRAVAAALRAAQHEILRTTSDQTHLSTDELKPEFERMIGTLRRFADMAENRDWVRAAIDRPRKNSSEAIGPNHDLRRMLIPLGDVVAVFGASNFPLAYGVCGGDTASAWGAGCTVVVKEHPGHPFTGRLLTKIAREALAAVGAEGALGYVESEEEKDFTAAKLLVQYEDVCAVGFTGSIPGGLAIEKLARERKRPIPVFAEMSSTNPVFITAAALAERGEEIARELSASLLARYGQQCTCPGLMLLGDDDARFRDTLVAAVRAASPRLMLTPRVREHYIQRTREVGNLAGGPGEVEVVAQSLSSNAEAEAIPTLFGAEDMALSFSKDLTREIFGPAAVISLMGPDDLNRIETMLATMGGQLTASIYTATNAQEPADVCALIARLTRSVGRVVFNGVPTGVRVAHGMVHGGPYPATNRPDTTAVGPFAIERWCRPVCYQNCPQDLLPPELRDANQLGIGRLEDGVWMPARSRG
jgi:2,5-dioxopentanoate dehydrogenase